MILLLIFLNLKDFRELNDMILSNSQVIEESISEIAINGINREKIEDFLEKDIEKSIELGKINIVDGYLSSNKYMFLVPNNLKIKYFIDNKLDIEGIEDFLDIKK